MIKILFMFLLLEKIYKITKKYIKIKIMLTVCII